MSKLLRLIVKNESMKTDPDEIYNWRVYLLAASVSTSALVMASITKLTTYS